MSSSRTSYKPRPYQQLATNWLLDKPKAALFLDVGLGKSSVALTHMAYTLAIGEVKRWLIVAPLRVCQTTWPSELEKWAFAQHLSVYHLYGPLGKRRAAPGGAQGRDGRGDLDPGQRELWAG